MYREGQSTLIESTGRTVTDSPYLPDYSYQLIPPISLISLIILLIRAVQSLDDQTVVPSQRLQRLTHLFFIEEIAYLWNRDSDGRREEKLHNQNGRNIPKQSKKTGKKPRSLYS